MCMFSWPEILIFYDRNAHHTNQEYMAEILTKNVSSIKLEPSPLHCYVSVF